MEDYGTFRTAIGLPAYKLDPSVTLDFIHAHI